MKFEFQKSLKMTKNIYEIFLKFNKILINHHIFNLNLKNDKKNINILTKLIN